MRYDERDDGELVELARSGWSPAFAVLVHRHAPALLAAFADDPDPFERVTDVFIRAMRELPDHDPSAPVAAWLFALAGRRPPDHVPSVPEEALDPIWRELSLRWPDGRHIHRRRRPVVRRLAVIAGALALGVLVPLVVLGLPATPDDDAIESVRAQPLEEEPTEEPEPEDVPDFEFPDVTAGAVEGPTETSDDEPSAPPPSTDTQAPMEPAPETTQPPAPAPAEPVEPVDPLDPIEPPPAPDDDGTSDGTSDDGADGSTDGDPPPGDSDGGETSDGDGGDETLPVIGGDP
jgi:hypothetical protein